MVYGLPDTSKFNLFCRTELLDRATSHRKNADQTKDVELSDPSKEKFVTTNVSTPISDEIKPVHI
jgi:hypothetical protein